MTLSQFLSEVRARAEKAKKTSYMDDHYDALCPLEKDIPTLVAICEELAGALEVIGTGLDFDLMALNQNHENVLRTVERIAQDKLTRAAALAGKGQGRGE